MNGGASGPDRHSFLNFFQIGVPRSEKIFFQDAENDGIQTGREPEIRVCGLFMSSYLLIGGGIVSWRQGQLNDRPLGLIVSDSEMPPADLGQLGGDGQAQPGAGN